MWIGRTEYISLRERVARLEAAEEARRSEVQRGTAMRQIRDRTADARRLAAQFENLLAYDGTVQTGGIEDEEE